MSRCQNESSVTSRMWAPGSKEVTRQKALGSVQCVQDPGRENHHLICQLTAVRLTAAARHKWRLRWVRRSSYLLHEPSIRLHGTPPLHYRYHLRGFVGRGRLYDIILRGTALFYMSYDQFHSISQLFQEVFLYVMSSGKSTFT